MAPPEECLEWNYAAWFGVWPGVCSSLLHGSLCVHMAQGQCFVLDVAPNAAPFVGPSADTCSIGARDLSSAALSMAQADSLAATACSTGEYSPVHMMSLVVPLLESPLPG